MLKNQNTYQLSLNNINLLLYITKSNCFNFDGVTVFGLQNVYKKKIRDDSKLKKNCERVNKRTDIEGELGFEVLRYFNIHNKNIKINNLLITVKY